MGLFNNNNNKDCLRCPLIYLDGLSSLATQTQCFISLVDDKVTIETINTKQKFELNFSQIISIQQNMKQQITEKNKSVIKRGIVGNVLMGSTGAIIGGLSGLGTKEQSQMIHDLIIIYTTSSTNETNTLTFRSLNHNICQKIVESVNSKIPKRENNIKL